MKRALLILFLLFFSIPAQAKSYICRSDGSIDAFENGEEVQITKPLRQNEIEEAPLLPQNEPAKTETKSEKKRSDFVPLTQKEIEER